MKPIRIEILVTPDGNLKLGGEFASKIDALGALELAKHALMNQPAAQQVPSVLVARGNLPPMRNGA